MRLLKNAKAGIYIGALAAIFSASSATALAADPSHSTNAYVSGSIECLVKSYFGAPKCDSKEANRLNFQLGSSALTNVSPSDLALSQDTRHLFILDSSMSRIVVVDRQTDIAKEYSGGDGSCSPYDALCGDGQTIGDEDVTFSMPVGMALGPPGNTLYLADSLGKRVRRLDADNGTVTTIAGCTAAPPSRNCNIEKSLSDIYNIDGSDADDDADGPPSPAPGADEVRLEPLTDVATDSRGNIFISTDYTIYKLKPSIGGKYSIEFVLNEPQPTATSRISYSQGFGFCPGNNAPPSCGDNGEAGKAQAADITSIAFDKSGNLHFTDGSYSPGGADRTRKIIAGSGGEVDKNDTVVPVLGNGERCTLGGYSTSMLDPNAPQSCGADRAASEVKLGDLNQLAFDPFSGDMWVGETMNRILKVERDSNGNISRQSNVVHAFLGSANAFPSVMDPNYYKPGQQIDPSKIFELIYPDGYLFASAGFAFYEAGKPFISAPMRGQVITLGPYTPKEAPVCTRLAPEVTTDLTHKQKAVIKKTLSSKGLKGVKVKSSLVGTKFTVTAKTKAKVRLGKKKKAKRRTITLSAVVTVKKASKYMSLTMKAKGKDRKLMKQLRKSKALNFKISSSYEVTVEDQKLTGSVKSKLAATKKAPKRPRKGGKKALKRWKKKTASYKRWKTTNAKTEGKRPC